MADTIKKLRKWQDPTYTKAQWEAENPYLKKGMVGWELNSLGVVARKKVGPGYWNDLEYVDTSIYSYSDPVTEDIGDLKKNDVLTNRTWQGIIRDIVSSFQAPKISSIQNEAQGTLKETAIIEIGNSLSGDIRVVYAVTNINNLFDGDNVYINANGIFSNEGWRKYGSGDILLSLVNALSPGNVATYEINLKVKHERGESATKTTYIKFWPKLLWGVSDQETLTAIEFANIGFKKTKITNDLKQDLEFGSSGYHYFGIPTMLEPSGLLFADVTNPLIPLPVDITDLGILTGVNNGVGTYDYRIYRSTHDLINPITIRISTNE